MLQRKETNNNYHSVVQALPPSPRCNVKKLKREEGVGLMAGPHVATKRNQNNNYHSVVQALPSSPCCRLLELLRCQQWTGEGVM